MKTRLSIADKRVQARLVHEQRVWTVKQCFRVWGSKRPRQLEAPNVESGLLTSAQSLEGTTDAGHDHAAEEKQDPRSKRHCVFEGPEHPDERERRCDVREDVSSILHGASLSAIR